MNNRPETFDVELACVIVNFGQGSKIRKSARQRGFSGGTITLGRGTVNNRFIDFIGLSDIRKELVYLIADRDTAYRALDEMDREFEFGKPNHGIVFTTTIKSLLGSTPVACRNENAERSADRTMYDIITTITEKGRAEQVIDAATAAGAKGGTIINARGSGIHETMRVFAMEIEPEKEIVLILSERERTQAIADSIRDSLKIDEPGNGIIYIQEANRTYGIYKG